MSWCANVSVRRGSFSLEVSLEAGGALVVAGPNGAGKSTLLRALAGGLPLDAGRVEVGGALWECVAQGVRVPIEDRRVGYVPQGYGLFPHLDVRGNVSFGLPATSRSEVERQLAAFGLAELADRRPQTLSGGERQRVALVRALVRDPQLLLLDEPFAALDASARRSWRRELPERLQTLGVPTVVVSHDVLDAQAFGGPVAVLESGRLTQLGRLDELRADPATDYVAEYVAR